jgi:hypothetical protein
MPDILARTTAERVAADRGVEIREQAAWDRTNDSVPFERDWLWPAALSPLSG